MINKAIIVGNLGNDPDIMYLQSGKAKATFSLATSFGKDSKTQWHKCCVFDKPAEWSADWKKGDLIYIEGYIDYYNPPDTDKWFTTIIGQKILRLKQGKASQQDPANATKPQS